MPIKVHVMSSGDPVPVRVRRPGWQQFITY